MAGIYIHIPFCKSKCNYCDFYSETAHNKNIIDNYIIALQKEIDLRISYLQNSEIETIYFGGGTPSVLSASQINSVFDKINDSFPISKNLEFTFEANPDDINLSYLESLKIHTKVNRLSIGLQSFFEDDLKLMNRRHNALQSKNAIRDAQKVGFDNISGDLIYGLPKMTNQKWEQNLDVFFELNIQHLSAYHLTYESGTQFYKWLKNKEISEIPENNSIEQFEILMKKAEENNFIHYEISNFAKHNFLSKHNSNYWNRVKYMGLGTSAHSYNGTEREWNITNISKYIDSVFANKVPSEKEILSLQDKLNEYIMTSLRTLAGVDFDYIKNNFEQNNVIDIETKLNKKIETELIQKTNNFYSLTQKGKFISDSIILDLFVI